MKPRRQIVSMLFSDVKDYSKIKDDKLYVQLSSEFYEKFKRQHLNEGNHFFSKTWGDAFFICSYDPVDLAEIALNMRDEFKNENWRRKGFGEDLSVRIGVHAELANILLADNGNVKDVVGKNVNSTARIEPIVDPNHVFCSETFYRHLSNEELVRLKGVPLGKRKLAKNFGEIVLYKLLRDYEETESADVSAKPSRTSFNIPQTKIKRQFSDKDLNDFLRDSFEIISRYFREALQQLDNQNLDIETGFRQVNTDKFTCHVYVSGATKGQCQIWIANDYFGNSIHYSQARHFSDNSFNESISVQHDGFSMYFGATGMPLFGKREEKLTTEEAAAYLWKVFTRTLEY